jgi:hypothetical protein
MNDIRDGNRAVMLFHNPLANRKTQAGGIAPSAKAGFEDAADLVRPDSAACVREFNHNLLTIRAASLTRRATLCGL